MQESGERDQTDASVEDRMADHMNLALVAQGAEDAERLPAEHAKDADDCDQQDVHRVRQLN